MDRGVAAGRKVAWVLPFASLDFVPLPFLGFDASLGASSQVLGCRKLGCGASATSHNRDHVLVLTTRAGACSPFTEGMSGPGDVEQWRGHHEVWTKGERVGCMRLSLAWCVWLLDLMSWTLL